MDDYSTISNRQHVRSGLNSEQNRHSNLQTVLDAVRQYPGSTRPELASLIGLTVQSLHSLTEELLERKFLLRGKKRRGGRGQPATELLLNPDGAYSIGVHLDRDHLTGILMDLTGQVRAREHYELRLPTPKETFPLIEEMVKRLHSQIDQPERVWGIGAAFPGPLDLQTGIISQPPNFPGWDGINAKQEIEQRCQLPVIVQHDGAAAALGERWYGAGRGYSSFFYVFSGIGLGGGVVLGGHSFAGAHGNINFGHIPVAPGGLPCSCGSRGCVEMYASMQALQRILAEAGIENADRSEIEKLHAQGHPAVKKWLQQAATHLAPAITATTNLLGPEAIIFGGRLPEALQTDLLDILRRELQPYQIRGMPHTPLISAEIINDAASLGAATLPLYQGLTSDEIVNRSTESK